MDENGRLILEKFKIVLPTSESVIFFAILVSIFILFFVFMNLKRRKDYEKRNDKENWNWFHRTCETARLSANEGALLKKWAIKHLPKKPQNLLKSIDVIERLAEKEEGILDDIPEKRVAFSRMIENIRLKLFMHDILTFSIGSTQELKPGQNILISTEYKGRMYVFESEILKCTKSNFKISLPKEENIHEFEDNYPVEISVYQQDGSVYTFETTMKKYEKNAIVVNHSDYVSRTNQRHYFRIKTNIWGRYSRLNAQHRHSLFINNKFSKEWISRSLTCKVLSISEGGVSLLVRESCSLKEVIWVTFSLNDKVFLGDLIGRVLRVKSMPDDMFKVFVELIKITEADKYSLIRFISSTQLSKREVNKAVR